LIESFLLAKYIHYGDDYCLALLIKGVCLKHKGQTGSAEECFNYIIQQSVVISTSS